MDVLLLDEPTLETSRGMRDADVAVIEGLTGLFDGIGATQEARRGRGGMRALACSVSLVRTAASVCASCRDAEIANSAGDADSGPGLVYAC
jgi:cobyrinic acid a,c-diamide synthase